MLVIFPIFILFSFVGGVLVVALKTGKKKGNTYPIS